MTDGEILVRAVVENAGATYVGIQRAVPGLIDYSLVMFYGPCRSTCALKIDETLNTDSIRRKIEQKEAEFGCHQ